MWLKWSNLKEQKRHVVQQTNLSLDMSLYIDVRNQRICKFSVIVSILNGRLLLYTDPFHESSK